MKKLIFLYCLLSLTACGGRSEWSPQSKVYGRVFPERADDLAWENDLVAFRAYGPATQAAGEKVYGYDIFFKYPDSGLVLEHLYGAQTDSLNWATVDSLRAIDPSLAQEFISGFTYHVDHGQGMDCYPVGPTLGAGASALIDARGDIIYPRCYERVEILENGPERFEAHLVFEPREINDTDSVTEHRLISLAAGEHLNVTRVWYENLADTVRFIIGVPRRDDSRAVIDASAGYIAYGDPTDHLPGNIAMLGVVYDNPMQGYGEFDGHIGAIGTLAPGDTISYRWGYTWPKSDIADMASWNEYLEKQTKK